jgi:hypothetical protein
MVYSSLLELLIGIGLATAVILGIGQSIVKSTNERNRMRALGLKEPARPWWAKWRVWFWIVAIVLILYCGVILLDR